jgi:hypothetical protein
MDNTETDPNDVLYVMNKYIKYKTAARKSYIRTKVLKKDLNCDITQLCYSLYNAVENKVVVVNDNQENISNIRKIIKLEKELDMNKDYKDKYESSNRHNLQKRRLLDEKEEEISELKKQIKMLENKYVKKTDKSIFDFDDELGEVDDNNYDPYTEEYPDVPMRLTDFTDIKGQQAIYTATLNYEGNWESLTEEQKIELVLIEF